MEPMARTSTQLGAALRRYRRAAGLSQSAIAAKTRLRQATISALENGEAGTSLRTLMDVLTALNLELVIRERSKATGDIASLF